MPEIVDVVADAMPCLHRCVSIIILAFCSTAPADAADAVAPGPG
jgi:hypothetical protein